MLRYLTNKVEGNSCNEEEKEMSSSKYKTPNAKPSSVKLWACDVCKVTFPDYEQACRHEEACRQQEQNAQNAKEAARDTTTSFSQAKTMQRWSCDVCHEEFDDYDEACRHEKECAREKQQQRKQEEANSKGNAASKPVHPFFSGKEGVQGKEKNKKRSKQAETDAIEIQDDSEQVAPMPKKQKATKKQTEPTKKARSSRTEKSGDSTAASNKPQPNKKKKGNTQSTTPPLADIFGKRGASQIMAEHKAAEFAAKRRADAERERQRQKRRIEQHQQKLKESSEKAMQDAIQNKPLIPPEVRFPVPSHVVSNEDVVQDVDLAGSDTCWIDQDSLSKAQGRLEKTLRHSGSVEKATEEVEDCNPLLSTNAKPLVTQDALQNALSDLLAPPEKPLNSNSTEAWTDKYSIQNVPEDVCGADNKETAQELVKFVNEWKVERGKAHERRAEKQQALLKKKKKKRRYREDDIWEDSEEEDGLCSVCLLTGPSGSGKTNLVHAVARQSDCIVLEINTTERRGGTALKNAIEEATQSDSSLDMLKKNQMAVDADPLVDSDDEQEETAKKASSIIVVLIDEGEFWLFVHFPLVSVLTCPNSYLFIAVDIIFEEEGDAGFWNAMSTLAKKAKCPIFLTANTVPESLLSSHIRYLHVETSLPRPEECVPKVKRILKKEGLHRRERFTESSAANKQLSLISQLCKCDLRRIVNELQLFATAPPRSGSEGDDPMKCESSTVDNASPSEYLGPTIRDISPREVSPHDLSLVTIRGKHFTPETSLEVYFGSQVSPAVKVLNDSTILAVCPPCSVAAGVTDSGVIERTGRESRTSRFAPVSIKVYAHGKVLSRSDAVEYTTNELCDGTPCSSIGGHWNIEYAFPPPRYGILGNQHVDSDDESIEAEFGSDERPRPVVPDPAPAVTTSQRTFTKEEAEAVLEKGISEWKAAHAESEASTETESGSARLMITPDGESSGGLDVLSTLTKVSSDAALLEDGLESGGIPFLAGVVPGFGSSLVNDVARNNTDTNDQKRRKLLRDANARP